MAPSSKRIKLQPERYPCHTCLTDRTSSQFPDYNPTDTCEHLINTCKQCLRAWIVSQIESKAFNPHIKCPQCDEKMTRGDVEMAVTKKVFARYDELERNYIAENTPGWRWCLAINCRAGQVHESSKPEEPIIKAEEAAIKPEGSPPKSTSKKWVKKLGFKKSKKSPPSTPSLPPPKPDICVCNACGAKACVACDRPWHESETCEEYQARVKDRIEEEDKSLAVIQKQSRKCPNCAKNIEKNGGCRHMLCTQCNTEFCWHCMELINRNGRYCGCAPPAPPAPPHAVVGGIAGGGAVGAAGEVAGWIPDWW